MSKPSPLLLVTAYLGFISLGLPDTLLGVAWPFVRAEFGLGQGAAAAVFVAMGAAYALSGSAAGKLLGALGTGRLLAVSSAAVTLAVFGFGLTPVWGFFALGAMVHGFGSGAIDTGLNDYVARRFAPKHMNWLHACFSLGAAAGPAVMTAAVHPGGDWRQGYLTVGTVLLVLTVLFFLTLRLWAEQPAPGMGEEAAAVTPAAAAAGTDGTAGAARPGRTVRAGLRETLRLKAVRWQLALFFVYTGIESAVGQWAFTLLTEDRGLASSVAGSLVTAYWSAIFAGRVLGGFLVARVGSRGLVAAGIAGTALSLPLLLVDGHPAVTAVALVLTGLFLAPVFPGLMTLTPERTGPAHSANAIGLQVTAATLGVACWPSLAGAAAQELGAGVLAWVLPGQALLLWAVSAGGRRALTGRGAV